MFYSVDFRHFEIIIKGVERRKFAIKSKEEQIWKTITTLLKTCVR